MDLVLRCRPRLPFSRRHPRRKRLTDRLAEAEYEVIFLGLGNEEPAVNGKPKGTEHLWQNTVLKP
jgi:hypothetical protein